MNKEELVSNIKQWIILDEEIKNLQRQIKEKRNEKKENTETLVRIMRDNEIDCFELDSNGGKLIYTKQIITNTLIGIKLLSLNLMVVSELKIILLSIVIIMKT